MRFGVLYYIIPSEYSLIHGIYGLYPRYVTMVLFNIEMILKI